MDRWLLLFRQEGKDVRLGRAGPFRSEEVCEAATVALRDGYEGAWEFEVSPDLGEAARRVADGRRIGHMKGAVRLYVPQEQRLAS